MINIINSSQKCSVEDQWLGWLRGSMISWLSSQYRNSNKARVDYASIICDLEIVTREHTLKLATRAGNEIKRTLGIMVARSDSLAKVFLAGEDGWRVIQGHTWNKQVSLHWIGEWLPTGWEAVDRCTFYVPEYGISSEQLGMSRRGDGIVRLPYLPVMKGAVGSTQLRMPRFVAETPTMLCGEKKNALPVFMIGECNSSPEEVMEVALRDQEIDDILHAVDQCNAIRMELLCAVSQHALLFRTAKRAMQRQQSFALFRWLQSQSVKPDQEEVPVSREGGMDTVQENAVQLIYIGRQRSKEGEALSSKREQTIYPGFYKHSLLRAENYIWQIQQVVENTSAYMIVPAAHKTCVAEIITRQLYRSCRNRIWVVIKPYDKEQDCRWVWKYHDQGFFHVVELGCEQPIISLTSLDHNPEPINNLVYLWEAWNACRQEETKQKKAEGSRLFCSSSNWWGSVRVQAHSENPRKYSL